jgi:transcriptional regulator with XRE-family HTH domain
MQTVRGGTVRQNDRRPDIEIGPTIRTLRLERGMTLDQLAAGAGISASHLSRLERGQAEPSFTVAAALAKEIGVTLSDLVRTTVA